MSLFTTGDYPQAALRAGEQGTSEVGLTIGVDGRIEKCEVLKSSGSASLDEATCTVFRSRARFTPAHDANGQATTDHISTRVRWVLPARPAFPVEFASTNYIFPIDRNRRITGCQVESSRQATREGGTCEFMLELAKRLVLTAPKSVALEGHDMIMATEFLVGSPVAASQLGQGTGEFLVGRDTVHLSIDASGMVVTCSEESVGPYKRTDAPCEEARQMRYEPLPDDAANRGERRMSIITALYLRKR